MLAGDRAEDDQREQREGDVAHAWIELFDPGRVAVAQAHADRDRDEHGEKHPDHTAMTAASCSSRSLSSAARHRTRLRGSRL